LMERTLRRRRVPGFAGLVLEELRCFFAILSEDCCFLQTSWMTRAKCAASNENI
jgi:hypothetical protein